MYLSQLLLNIRDQHVRRHLSDYYKLHCTLWQAFPKQDEGGAGRVLFRVDTGKMGPILLVQSVHQPDWSTLPVGFLRAHAEAKPLNVSFTEGQRLRFRLRANPTKRVAAKNEHLGSVMCGKRIGLLTENDQIRWIVRKGEAGGFSIPGNWVPAKDPETGVDIELPNFRVDAIPEGRLRDVKNDGSTLHAVRYEGVLIVTDPSKFRETLFAGIGSAKGFGFGLLSVAPA